MTGVNPFKHHVFYNDELEYKNHDHKSFLWHARNEFGLKTLVVANMADVGILEAMVEDDAFDLQMNKYDHKVEDDKEGLEDNE